MEVLQGGASKAPTISEEKLNSIRLLSADQRKVESEIVSAEMNKSLAVKKLESIYQQYAKFDEEVVKEFGLGAVVNLRTGEVTIKVKQ